VRIHLAANYAGYTLGRSLETQLGSAGHEVVWQGPPDYDKGDDYPVFAVRVGQAVVQDEDAGLDVRGIVVGGDGGGETIAANKVNGARAVPGLNTRFVRAARAHADANVLVLPSDLLLPGEATEVVAAFIEEKFLADLDDARRIVNTAEYEASGTIEGWLINN